jgi:hypothetical protein
MSHFEARDILIHASKYLRDTHGRSITEEARRILTTAIKLVGTDKVLDVNIPYIEKARRSNVSFVSSTL